MIATNLLALGALSLTSLAAVASESSVPDPRWSLVYHLEVPGTAPPAAPFVPYTGLARIGQTPPQSSLDVAVLPDSNVTQSENSVAVDPYNPQLVFVATNATDWPVTQVYGSGVYWSLDGGATWSGDDHGPGGVGNSGDPAVVIRALDGRWLVNYITPGFGQGVSYTDDHGATWTHVVLFAAGTLDKNHMMVDNVPSSPFYGNLYAAWSALGGGPNANDIELVRSTDGGDTWSGSATDISRLVNSGSHDQGVNIQVGPNGEVYAVWAIYDSWPSNEDAIGFNSSTDGGATWTGEFRAITNIRGHRNTSLPNTTIRHNSFPSMAVDASSGPNQGSIYVVWTNQGVPGVNTGDADIYLAKSTDSGATFGTPVRVNQDSTLNAQWQPWVACDPATGVVSVIFYDRRDDPSDAMARAYMAVSRDGGVSWEDFPVGDVGFSPTPVPGLAGGYMGDYLGLAAAQGMTYPTWSDNRTGNMLCYVSPVLLLDPEDPNPPSGFGAFSDFTTPSSAVLGWTDPLTRVDGTPLTDFSIDILRDGLFLTNVDQGLGAFADTGLVDGQAYVYNLLTRDDVTDSLSTKVQRTVFAGGSPVPGPPVLTSCDPDTVSATLHWSNPSVQNDGTALDDFAGIRIYRDGVFLTELSYAAPDTGSAASYTDMPPPGFVYRYRISAVDSETPVHESVLVGAPECYVGYTPNILVWQPATVTTATGDSIVAALTALGETAARVGDLFTFSSDLSVHEMVFACVGVSPNKHLITPAEGTVLDAYVSNGGRLYLEGGDCFSDDPYTQSGYDVQPMFGLAQGWGGTGDLFDMTGENDLAPFGFTYTGPNVSIDALSPSTCSPVLFNSTTTGIVGVFHAGYGQGRTIGVSFEFGGLDQPLDPVNSRIALMSSYLDFFRWNGDPRMTVTPDTIQTAVQQTQSDVIYLSITNPGTPNGDLYFAVTESPEVSWLDVVDTEGGVPANGSYDITVNLSAAGLPPGPVSTDLIVAGNDPSNPADTVAITMDVEGIPMVSVNPAAIQIAVPLETTRRDTVVIANVGFGPFDYNVTMIGSGGTDQESFSATDASLTTDGVFLGNIYSVDNGLPITRVEQYLSTSQPTWLKFVVYEESPDTGVWAKTYERTILSATGLGWYSTGPAVIFLKPQRNYLIGCGWEDVVTAYRDNGDNAPQNVVFGNLVGSSVEYEYPPPDSTYLGGGGNAIWSQRLSFGIPITASVVAPAAGTLDDGEQADIQVSVSGENTSAVYYAALNVFHDAPFQPPILIPITIVVGDATVGVPDDSVAPPVKFALRPATPNPFRGSTRIGYDLDRPSRVLLTIFDVDGRLVRVLQDGSRTAGSYEVDWNGTNTAGLRVAPGVYFYSLESENRVSRRKLILLR